MQDAISHCDIWRLLDLDTGQSRFVPISEYYKILPHKRGADVLKHCINEVCAVIGADRVCNSPPRCW
ncbi:hypothetical protein NDU88_003659 [Pleurodeles waltl]|uniref:Uncharacterized protein n=1 Tax=Pleurodeles waltl TaxID=8319 RepID=A0AAV7V236_PLEWA|nr:hypothetical protein NDU88_003659 [Pleurodeles waltl]